MGYLHINNTYKDQTILLFKECYAMEKIHGTSAHISWINQNLTLSSGGASPVVFAALFDMEKLTLKIKEKFGVDTAIIYGEAYGGKEQGMSKTYGDKLKFCVFDVQINGKFVDVPTAEIIAKELDLEFVPYEKIEVSIENLDRVRDLPSEQAVRNGMKDSTDKYGFCPPIREGVVLRPLKEMDANYGRVISKHKRIEFQERQNQPTVIDANKQQVLDDAKAIADEWVVAVRLEHVLDKLGNPTDISMTGKVKQAMVEDIMREAVGEIVDTKEVRQAIGTAAANMFKRKIMKV